MRDFVVRGRLFSDQGSAEKNQAEAIAPAGSPIKNRLEPGANPSSFHTDCKYYSHQNTDQDLTSMAAKFNFVEIMLKDFARLIVQEANILEQRSAHLSADKDSSLVSNPPAAREQKKCSGATQSDTRQESQKFAPEQIHWIETYSPGKRRGYSYYRYVWMEGRKLRHMHLPGGNVDNPKAIALKERVEEAITAGWPPNAIEQLIKQRQ